MRVKHKQQSCLHAEIGSQKYRILFGLVLVSDVIILAKSLDTFLPISAPKLDNKPPSLNPAAPMICAAR